MEFTGITRVKVEGAPGYADFEGVLLLVTECVDGRGGLGVVMREDEPYVIPTRYIKEL